MNKTGKVNQSSRAPIKKGFGDRAIRFKCSMQNTILDVLRSKGWVEVKEDDTDFDLFWADRGWMREYFDQCFMEDHVRINHFRNHYELTRKNLMVKNLKRYKKNLDREVGKLEAAKCDFFPTTFELPSEYHMFVDEFKRNPGSVWIMKPVAKSQGKGIFLFRKLKDITEWKKSDIYRPREEKIDEKEPPETYIVSKYIERPYVIGGRKFDLRVYVLVTSLLRITSTHNALVTFCKRLRSLVQDPSMMYTLQQQQHIGSRKQYVPLKAWLYREGFARFSNTRFSLESIDDAYVHLTNVAVQKTAPDYDPDKGCKWSLRQVRQYLTAKHGLEPVEELVRQMNAVFINSLLSVQKIMINDKHCFELYGYDILIDANLKPWLIEVNASPSLTASGPEDYTLKLGLLEDVLHIVDMENRLTGKEKRVGGFDLMWDDGPVFAEEGGLDCINPPSYSTNTYLGCYNDRKKQLRNLCKQLMAQKKTGS